MEDEEITVVERELVPKSMFENGGSWELVPHGHWPSDPSAFQERCVPSLQKLLAMWVNPSVPLITMVMSSQRLALTEARSPENRNFGGTVLETRGCDIENDRDFHAVFFVRPDRPRSRWVELS